MQADLSGLLTGTKIPPIRKGSVFSMVALRQRFSGKAFHGGSRDSF